MTLATVVIPTFDHGPTLRHSIASVLNQSVADLELFVVGDGVPDISRDILAEFGRRDPRVRFFDNPKGPRNGEIHRNAALRDARGTIVAYLSDDDLWLPSHLETIALALERADFAHSLPVIIKEKGSIHAWPADLSNPRQRELVASARKTGVPLGAGAHTLALYRRLPHGWRTTPAGIPTDRYMWAQIFSQPDLRVALTGLPTYLHFPSPLRRDWTIEARVAELAEWERRIADPRWRAHFERRVRRWTGVSRGWLRRWVDTLRGGRASR